MDLDGNYFVFDFSADYLEGTAFAVMQVENGTLVERFHPADHGEFAITDREDDLALQYLRSQNITKVYSTTRPIEPAARFLNHTLWWKEELTDPDFTPGQWEFYVYSPVEEHRLQKLQQQGIEVILIDPTPYITPPAPETKTESRQLILPFIFSP